MIGEKVVNIADGNEYVIASEPFYDGTAYLIVKNDINFKMVSLVHFCKNFEISVIKEGDKE